MILAVVFAVWFKKKINLPILEGGAKKKCKQLIAAQSNSEHTSTVTYLRCHVTRLDDRKEGPVWLKVQEKP